MRCFCSAASSTSARTFYALLCFALISCNILTPMTMDGSLKLRVSSLAKGISGFLAARPTEETEDSFDKVWFIDMFDRVAWSTVDAFFGWMKFYSLSIYADCNLNYLLQTPSSKIPVLRLPMIRLFLDRRGGIGFPSPGTAQDPPVSPLRTHRNSPHNCFLTWLRFYKVEVTFSYMNSFLMRRGVRLLAKPYQVLMLSYCHPKQFLEKSERKWCLPKKEAVTLPRLMFPLEILLPAFCSCLGLLVEFRRSRARREGV